MHFAWHEILEHSTVYIYIYIYTWWWVHVAEKCRKYVWKHGLCDVPNANLWSAAFTRSYYTREYILRGQVTQQSAQV
jgi:hypothetical protein